MNIKYSSVLSDQEIEELCYKHGMITPFINKHNGKPSYGLGGFSYDIRLDSHFLIPLNRTGIVLDPVDFPSNKFKNLVASDELMLAPNSYILAQSVESFQIPHDVVGICCGKSSYARCGLSVNTTVLQPGWTGVLTLELANLARFPINLHIGQGIAQIIFFRGSMPKRIYGINGGILYQNQTGVTGPI